MTDLLYLNDCYLRECDARVIESGPNWVVLDRTVFYPTGGGQEHDTGTMTFDGGAANVTDARKDKGQVKHFVDKNVPAGVSVHCVVDWTRRHANMRMHTSQHLVSAVVLELFKASTVGNQIHPERSRIDFAPAHFSDDDLRSIEQRANALISEKRPVSIEYMSREDALNATNAQRTDIERIPKNVQQLRLIRIKDYDLCPCGGTHVSNLQELGRVRIVGLANKGKDVQRMEYVLE
ncbi:MAG: alanyl-tRNA editing protein [Candidatus Aenigmatarchaeota archaeon]|nr:MAG: alanyl-tRNA editing protein [Candidatus Aenigmarchaeota archaeon]